MPAIPTGLRPPRGCAGSGCEPPSPPTSLRWALAGPSTESADGCGLIPGLGLQGLAGDPQLGRGLLKPGEAKEVCPAPN